VTKGKSITGPVTESGNTFPESTSVTIKIKLASSDKFTAWYESTGKTVSTVPLYTFNMRPADIVFSTDQPVTGVEKKSHVNQNISFDYVANTVIINRVPSTVSIDIYSLSGKKVSAKHLVTDPKASSIRVPLGFLSKGTYLFRVSGDNSRSELTFKTFVN
jgi:hypothetical protein